jgi:serine/threonine-protein kinase
VNAATPPTSNSISVSVEEPAAPSPSATAPPAAARPIEARPRPGRPAPRAAKSATAETSSAKSTLPPAPARPNCNPPYELDSEGVKIWKRGCL